MIWFIDFNCIFFLLFIYLINANVNHEKLMDEFPKSIDYIDVSRICVFFSRVFFFFLENQTRIYLFLIIINLFH